MSYNIDVRYVLRKYTHVLVSRMSSKNNNIKYF